jgi:cytochrome c oxidase subunit 3
MSRPVRTSAATTGVWVGIATISMSFAAYTSAMIVRQGAAEDWQHFKLPSLLLVDTLLLIASSGTLEGARRTSRGGEHAAEKDVIPLPAASPPERLWLLLTLALGLLFLAGQLLAWRTLARQGLYLSTNPSSAFFYILTALHGLHLLGGIGALGYACLRVGRRVTADARRVIDAVSLYWHFMAVLWLYLLLVLAVWI